MLFFIAMGLKPISNWKHWKNFRVNETWIGFLKDSYCGLIALFWKTSNTQYSWLYFKLSKSFNQKKSLILLYLYFKTHILLKQTVCVTFFAITLSDILENGLSAPHPAPHSVHLPIRLTAAELVCDLLALLWLISLSAVHELAILSSILGWSPLTTFAMFRETRVCF